MKYEYIITITDNQLEVHVPFPVDYPDTAFRHKRNNKPLAYLRCTFFTGRDIIELHSFYVYAKDRTYRTLDDIETDIQLTRGLGKKMLCTALRYLVDSSHISIDAIVELEAIGGDDDCIESTSITEYEVDLFLQDFPNDSRDRMNSVVERPLSLFEKRSLFCEIISNRKLVEYYKKLHFEPIIDASYRATMVKMRGTIRNILEQCKMMGKIVKGKKSKRVNRSCKNA